MATRIFRVKIHRNDLSWSAKDVSAADDKEAREKAIKLDNKAFKDNLAKVVPVSYCEIELVAEADN